MSHNWRRAWVLHLGSQIVTVGRVRGTNSNACKVRAGNMSESGQVGSEEGWGLQVPPKRGHPTLSLSLLLLWKKGAQNCTSTDFSREVGNLDFKTCTSLNQLATSSNKYFKNLVLGHRHTRMNMHIGFGNWVMNLGVAISVEESVGWRKYRGNVIIGAKLIYEIKSWEWESWTERKKNLLYWGWRGRCGILFERHSWIVVRYEKYWKWRNGIL